MSSHYQKGNVRYLSKKFTSIIVKRIMPQITCYLENKCNWLYCQLFSAIVACEWERLFWKLLSNAFRSLSPANKIFICMSIFIRAKYYNLPFIVLVRSTVYYRPSSWKMKIDKNIKWYDFKIPMCSSSVGFSKYYIHDPVGYLCAIWKLFYI